MRRIILAVMVATMFPLPFPALASDDEERKAIFVVIENGGVVTDRDGALETIQYTLGELVELRRRRADRDTQIHIILSASPTEVSWSGTPQQLYDQGHAVLELMAFRDSCSDLVLAWGQVDLTVQITMPDDVRLIGIGPMIHAGFPCDQGETVITLPQAMPTELQLGPLALEASQLRLLNLHGDQDEMVLQHLKDAGVIARVRAGQLDADLMDSARTRSQHGSILGGRR